MTDSESPLRALPERGREQSDLLAELMKTADEEDRWWRTGKCSGTMYSGDDGLYELIGQVFQAYSHVNVLQRDMCPSQTRFESEIIAMALDLLGGGEVQDAEPCGVITSGGSDSIIAAMLAYRDRTRAERGGTDPEVILPTTAHPAFRKGLHYFGIRPVMAPVDPQTTQVDLDFVRDHINEKTIAMVGSAGNYPYGTLDPIEELSDLALKHGIGLHVDGCLGGFILPWGRELGYNIPPFDFRLPGVTSMSADTHKYGYGPKGTSVCLFRDKSLRRHQYYIATDWEGGIYCSPGMSGSRSGGLIAATWAVMVSLGREGYLERARKIFETSYAMQKKVTALAPLRLMGTPSFCFSFTSDEFDIYHVNDFLKEQGWRLNGQQFPSALHMCVTGPQTQPGLVEEFGDQLSKAVEYAQNPSQSIARSGALYGGAGTRSVASDLDMDRLTRTLVAYLDSTLEQ